ncbi:MAG: hypothetical protein ABSC94_22920 [Polyangiaceae bacterium]|jgi:hypothetical protein
MKVFRSRGLAGAICTVVLLAGMPARSRDAFAEDGKASAEGSVEGVEHTIIVGVGGAAELELRGGAVHPGGNLMLEWDAIENWLELEVGASVLSADGGVEVPIDLLVKKPFRLTRWAEFMVAIGPEVVAVSNPTTKATYFGGEAALDFMFWPWERHVGLWIEPEYDFIFRDVVSHGLGSTGGLLFGW